MHSAAAAADDDDDDDDDSCSARAKRTLFSAKSACTLTHFIFFHRKLLSIHFRY